MKIATLLLALALGVASVQAQEREQIERRVQSVSPRCSGTGRSRRSV